MSSIFKFKQFEVDQSGCAMKINTDGVLLAALAVNKDPHFILDIGTGTGVIALMLAQRFEKAHVHAVEIDPVAAATAGKNFEHSPFKSRLHIHPVPINAYVSELKFDLIVSNPPFFTNDLRNVEEKKGQARHAATDFFEELIAKVAELLSAEGRFWFILPLKQTELLVELAKSYGLFVVEYIYLHSDAYKSAFRCISCLSWIEKPVVTSRFNIYEKEKVYTLAYGALLKDFFLGY